MILCATIIWKNFAYCMCMESRLGHSISCCFPSKSLLKKKKKFLGYFPSLLVSGPKNAISRSFLMLYFAYAFQWKHHHMRMSQMAFHTCVYCLRIVELPESHQSDNFP